MENTFKEEAIVLKKTPVKETDLSITVYTKTLGRENIYIPKGQIIKSFIPTYTEPLNWFKGVFFRKRDTLYIKEIDRFKNLALPLSKDLEKFYTGFFITDLFNRYAVFPDEKLFILLKKSLYYLQYFGKVEVFKTNFLAKFIYLSGIYPETKHCVICGKKISKSNYGTVSIKHSGVLCSSCVRDDKSFLLYKDLVDIQILKKIPFQRLKQLKDMNSTRIQTFLKEYLSEKL